MSYFGPDGTPLDGTSIPVPLSESPLTEPLVADQHTPYTVTDNMATGESLILSDMNQRLARIENSIESLKQGVNTIGGMMNGVAAAFDQIMTEFKKGGLPGLLGGFMGGKKNG